MNWELVSDVAYVLLGIWAICFMCYIAARE